jgi:hypothetical protein
MQATEVVENVTGSLEVDVALTVNVCAGVGAGNVIVCGASVTVKVPAFAGAAAYTLLPA